jgi:UPF0716 family protein affecting phage T7 exclusion
MIEFMHHSIRGVVVPATSLPDLFSVALYRRSNGSPGKKYIEKSVRLMYGAILLVVPGAGAVN